MFKKILAKTKDASQNEAEQKEITDKVSKMNTTELKTYVNNKLKDFQISEDGLSAVMTRLNSKDAKGNRYLETDAMDSKKKKVFDLVILISKNTKMTMVCSELIHDFSDVYSDILKQYDKDNMDIYESRVSDAFDNSIATLEKIKVINRKIKSS